MTYKYHTPVLLKEVIDYLNCRSSGLYIDVTLGGGGWSEAILEASGDSGRVVAFDRDMDAIGEAKARLEKYSDRFGAYQSTFSSLASECDRIGIGKVDGVVADLGVSSYQLDEADRGFSFSKEAPLDMRMDRNSGFSAYDLVNTSRAEDLADWFYQYGEERFSRRIARAIVKERGKEKIETTKQLADIVSRAMPGRHRYGKIHPATRVFQALRIVVNDELAELEKLIEDMPYHLNAGGRIVIVSYHSLEDRIVKHKFRELGATDEFKRVTKKPVRPTEEEIGDNRRARSARLRVLERV